MDYMTHNGVQYEISILSLAHEEGVAVELVDLSPEGALLGEVRLTKDHITLVHQEPMPTAVYEWWTRLIIEAARSQVDDA